MQSLLAKGVCDYQLHPPIRRVTNSENARRGFEDHRPLLIYYQSPSIAKEIRNEPSFPGLGTIDKYSGRPPLWKNNWHPLKKSKTSPISPPHPFLPHPPSFLTPVAANGTKATRRIFPRTIPTNAVQVKNMNWLHWQGPCASMNHRPAVAAENQSIEGEGRFPLSYHDANDSFVSNTNMLIVQCGDIDHNQMFLSSSKAKAF